MLAGGNGIFAGELARCAIPHRSLRHLVKQISPVEDLLALREVIAVLRKIKPDLVAAHTAKAGFIGRLACGVLRLPAVFTPHGWAITDRISPNHGRLFLWMERLAGLFSARIVNVCEFERQLALQHAVAPARKMAVIHNGMPDVPMVLRADPGVDPPRLVMVARMARPKDHATLLEALAPLKELAWELDFIGEGPLESALREHAARLGINERVRFLGFRTDVPAQLARAQIFVLASRFEAFPYSTIEAMRAGLPVLATDVGGVQEAIVNGSTGFLAPAGDVKLLEGCLRTLISDPLLRRRLGDAGRQRFLKHFTFERMVARTLALYGQVVSARQTAELSDALGTPQ